MSYSVSDPPIDLQIEDISLSSPHYYAVSDYEFMLKALPGASFSIAKFSRIGVIVHFPAEYSKIWTQITVPSSLTLKINGGTYSSTSIQMASRYVFAVFPSSIFTAQLDFSTLNISFAFRNPNQTINCSVTPVFTISIFDFKGNNLYAQSLSNNKVCPNLTTHLFAIKVTGNTRISAGTSSTFYVTLEKPAKNLTVTPASDTSAISFKPETITFTNYSRTSQTFKVIAANGLSG